MSRRLSGLPRLPSLRPSGQGLGPLSSGKLFRGFFPSSGQEPSGSDRLRKMVRRQRELRLCEAKDDFEELTARRSFERNLPTVWFSTAGNRGILFVRIVLFQGIASAPPAELERPFREVRMRSRAFGLSVQTKGAGSPTLEVGPGQRKLFGAFKAGDLFRSSLFGGADRALLEAFGLHRGKRIFR